MWKTPKNWGDRKPWGLRPINRNPLFKIKSHRFTWPLYPKDLLFSTYNLIDIRDATTACCSLLESFGLSEGIAIFNQQFKESKSWMRE